MKVLMVVLAAWLAPDFLAAQSGSPSDSSLLAAREAVWRDFFAASPRLAATLPENFVALQTGDTAWDGRTQTLEDSKASAARGVRLTALRFPRNVIQRYDNVAILHSRYELELQEKAGESQTIRGQVTEVFVWTGSRWIHPSWHLDWPQ
jgi:hypothetical protein